jgi:hypothetical protein
VCVLLCWGQHLLKKRPCKIDASIKSHNKMYQIFFEGFHKKPTAAPLHHGRNVGQKTNKILCQIDKIKSLS